MEKIKFYAIKQLEWDGDDGQETTLNAVGINGAVFSVMGDDGVYSLFLDGNIVVQSLSNKDSVINLANEIHTARVEAVLGQWVALPEMVLERAAGDTGTYKY